MSIFLSVALIVVLVVIDQVTKFLAVQHLEALLPKGMAIIENVFELRYAENKGIGFSLLEGLPWIFIPVSMIITILIIVMMLRSPMRKNYLFSCANVLIVAGAIGNMIDRIVNGYVVDFLYFKLINFPIFNIADCCVVIGAGLLFLFILFFMKEDEDASLLTIFFGIPTRGKKHE